MFQVFTAPPRTNDDPTEPGGKLEIDVDKITVREPGEAPKPDSRPMWQRFMPLLIIGFFVSIMALMVIAGIRNWLTLIPMIMMPVMLLLNGVFGNQNTGTSPAEIAEARNNFDDYLATERTKIHDRIRRMHKVRARAHPHPDDLNTMVGTNEMWQCSPDAEAGVAYDLAQVPEEDRATDLLTINPYLRLRVGTGAMPLYPSIAINPDLKIPEQYEPLQYARHQKFHDTFAAVGNIPIDLPIADFRGFAFRSPVDGEDAVLQSVRGMVLSAAFNHPPSVLQIAVVTNTPEQWEWIKFLPHNENTDDIDGYYGAGFLAWPSMDDFAIHYAKQLEERKRATNPDDHPPHVLLIIDTPDETIAWPDRYSLGVNHMTAFAVRYASEMISARESRIFVANGRLSTVSYPDGVAYDEVSIETATAFAKNLARYRVPDGGSSRVAEVDERVPDMFEALGISDIETHDLIAEWQHNFSIDKLEIPWGTMRDGDKLRPQLNVLNITEKNRDGDGLHGDFAGETGSGKSFALRALVECAFARFSPGRLSWILADFKAGSTFLGMDDVPHVVANVSDLESAKELVDRLGDIVLGHLEWRKEFITEQKQFNDIYKYREEQQRHPNDPDWPEIPDLIFLIDEFAEFLKDRPEFAEKLEEIGTVGRAYGYHIIMCSQSITKSLLGGTAKHMQFHYSLNVSDSQSSQYMFGSDAAMKLDTKKGGLKGKMIRKFGTDQTPVECIAFNHEKPYVRRTEGAKSSNHATRAGEQAPTTLARAIPLLPDRARDQRQVLPSTTSGETGARKPAPSKANVATQGDVLLDKLYKLKDLRALNLWTPSLREPHTYADMASTVGQNTSGLKIRIGDLDDPFHSVRLPWELDFSGSNSHTIICGAAKSGRTMTLQTLVLMGAIQTPPHRLSFMIIDRGTGRLSVLKDSPNVSAYAGPTDDATASRIFGELAKIIDERRRVMANLGTYTVDDYLAAKANDPELMAADPYGYIILCLDNLGGYLGNKEDRKPRSVPLSQLLDNGADRGIFLVFTADNASVGMSGNVMPFELSGKVSRDIQLYNTSYGVINGGIPFRAILESKIPEGQPGRSVVPIGTDSYLLSRIAVPLMTPIEPDQISTGGNKVFHVKDYPTGDTVRFLQEHYGPARAHQLETVATDVPFDRIYDVYAQHWPLDPHRNLAHTKHPIGVQVSTGALELLPAANQHLIVYGRPKSGRTTTLRVMMESVMRQYTPQQARIVIIDPRRLMSAEARDAQNRGFVATAQYSTDPETNERVVTKPSGYVTNYDQIPDTITMLGKVMQSNLPPEDIEPEDIEARSFVKGPEIFVFVDNFDSLTGETAMARSVFDDLGPLLRSYGDLGVHFIIATNQDLKGQLATSVFMKNLRNLAEAPVMQLAGPARNGHLDSDYAAVPSEDWPAGRGRLLYSGTRWELVQIANQPRPARPEQR